MTIQPNPDEVAWMNQAMCKGRTDEFFIARGDTEAVTHAKSICSTCPVITQCRDYVIYNPEIYGIWGGMTERERRAYRLANGIELSSFAHGTRGKFASGCRCYDCRFAVSRLRTEWRRR